MESKTKKERKSLTLNELLDHIDGIIQPEELDMIKSRAEAVKKIRTSDALYKGDVVRLSQDSSPTLYNQFKDEDIVITEVDRDGQYHIVLGEFEGKVSRDKVLLIRKGDA